MVKKQRLDRLKKQIDKRAAYAVALACIAPPPFPFTAVIGAAGALQYPRRKLFSIAFAARLVWFPIVSALAVEFGRQILAIVKSNAFLGDDRLHRPVPASKRVFGHRLDPP